MASPSVPAGSSSTTSTTSVAERARAKYSNDGIQVILAKFLGTAPMNRSGLGLSGFHVHEVVNDIMKNGFSTRRYREVTAVRVPPQGMAEFISFNKRLCEGDDLLPGFSPDIKFACLTKNHLAHAVKLFEAGTHVLHASTDIIQARASDSQLKRAMADGLRVEVMSEDLWEDAEAMSAIIGEDNLDAATNLAANEIEVLQHVRKLADDNKNAADSRERFRHVYAAARLRFGDTAYTEDDVLALFNYSMRVPSPLLTNLCQVHFATVPAALLRLRPVEFGRVAKLDSPHPYVKVALIIGAYLNAIAGKTPRRMSGGVAAFASGPNKQSLGILKEDDSSCEQANSFLKEMLKHYPVDMDQVRPKGLLTSRAKLFHRAARQLVQGWPTTAHGQADARSKMEAKYAKDLLDCGAFQAMAQPQPKHKVVEITLTAGTSQAKAKAQQEKTAASKDDPNEVLDESASGDEAARGAAATAGAAAAAGAQGVVIGEPRPKKQKVDAEPAFSKAYEISVDNMEELPPMDVAPTTPAMWKALAVQGMAQMLLRHGPATAHIQVHVMPASNPRVYQARALKDFGPGELVLTPFRADVPMDLKDGLKIKKAPASLHPCLPFLVRIEAGSFGLQDTSVFFRKVALGLGCRGDQGRAPSLLGLPSGPGRGHPELAGNHLPHDRGELDVYP